MTVGYCAPESLAEDAAEERFHRRVHQSLEWLIDHSRLDLCDELTGQLRVVVLEDRVLRVATVVIDPVLGIPHSLVHYSSDTLVLVHKNEARSERPTTVAIRAI